MATISERKRSSGVKYTAQIRIRRNGVVVHTEAKTFGTRALAVKWGKAREAELADPGALSVAQLENVTVGQVLEWYVSDYNGHDEFGRTKLSTILYLIGRKDLAELPAVTLTSGQLVRYVQKRRAEGTGPATVGNDLTWLRIAWRSGRIARDLPLRSEVIDDAAFLCRKEKLITRANERDRRPALAELDKLMTEFDGRDGRATIPMLDIALFAIFSTRRQDEICRILWEDYEPERQRVLVRDMKHPRFKRDTWVFLTDEAMAIIERQPKTDARIFPYNSKSVGTAWGYACKMVGIEDLHFHDLRHEGASWLFECGNDIPRVSGITGHVSWGSLKRYTHLRERGFVDKFAGWPWRPALNKKDV